MTVIKVILSVENKNLNIETFVAADKQTSYSSLVFTYFKINIRFPVIRFRRLTLPNFVK